MVPSGSSLAAQHQRQRFLDITAEVVRIDADCQLDVEGHVLRRLQLDVLARESITVDGLLELLAQSRSEVARAPGSAVMKTVYQLPVQRRVATAFSTCVFISATRS